MRPATDRSARGLLAGLVDHGAGNLRSIARALAACGATAVLIREPASEPPDVVVLPGVGAFGAAMRRLEEAGLAGWIRGQAAAGRPLVGVCLGMQLLYEESEESPGVRGLGLLAGRVRRLPPGPKVPHMGWNSLRAVRASPVMEGLDGEAYAYFVHSYVVAPEEEGDVVAVTRYGIEFPSVVHRGGLVGLQFHPEKSGTAGLRLLRNALDAAGAGPRGEEARPGGEASLPAAGAFPPVHRDVPRRRW